MAMAMLQLPTAKTRSAPSRAHPSTMMAPPAPFPDERPLIRNYGDMGFDPSDPETVAGVEQMQWLDDHAVPAEDFVTATLGSHSVVGVSDMHGNVTVEEEILARVIAKSDPVNNPAAVPSALALEVDSLAQWKLNRYSRQLECARIQREGGEVGPECKGMTEPPIGENAEGTDWYRRSSMAPLIGAAAEHGIPQAAFNEPGEVGTGSAREKMRHSAKTRDPAMTRRIKQTLAEHGGPVLVFVGLAHLARGEGLKMLGKRLRDAFGDDFYSIAVIPDATLDGASIPPNDPVAPTVADFFMVMSADERGHQPIGFDLTTSPIEHAGLAPFRASLGENFDGVILAP